MMASSMTKAMHELDHLGLQLQACGHLLVEERLVTVMLQGSTNWKRENLLTQSLRSAFL